MSLRTPHWLQSALLFTTTALILSSPAAMALEGKDLVKPVIDDLDLFMPNSNVIVTLENASHSGQLNDFQLKIQNHTLTLNGMTGVLHCGKHEATAVKNPAPPHSGTATYNGAPSIHFGIVGNSTAAGTGALYTLKDPDIQITTYERSNKQNTQGYVKKVQGSPWNFSIPVNKLVKPGNAGSLDIAAEFEKRMNAFISGGGQKIDFLRQDQHFDMVGHVTLEAACFSVFPRKGFHTKPIQVSIKYIGDKTLKYGSTIPGQTDPTLNLPLQTSAVSLTVNPAKQEAPCPYDVAAVASLTFNQTPAKPLPYKVRFLEDGKPATPWMSKMLQGSNTAEITHKIRIGALTPNQSFANDNKAQQPAPLKPLTIGTKTPSLVSVEVMTDNNAIKKADAHYQATCKPKNTATFELGRNDKPDLTSRVGISMGHQSASWGGKINLTVNDITDVTPRGCRVRYRYDVVNIGTGNATAFQNRLTVAGKQGDNATLPQLNVNQSQFASGVVLVTGGISQINIAIDSLQKIAESQENNNQFSVTVVAPDNCGGGTARPSPTSPQPRSAPVSRPTTLR